MPGPIDPYLDPDESLDAFVSRYERSYEERLREDAKKTPPLMAYFFMPVAPDLDAAVVIPVTFRPRATEQFRQLASFSDREYDALTRDFRQYLLDAQTRWYRQTN